jgi:hypothetical protein
MRERYIENVHYPGSEILGETPGIPEVIFSASTAFLGIKDGAITPQECHQGVIFLLTA